MPSILPITTLLQVADVSQYLAANDISRGKQLKSSFPAPSLALQIYNAKTAVRWIYTLNPNDPSLVQTGNYLYQLLGSYAIQAQNIIASAGSGAATISNPSNQSVTVGNSATFSVTVTSSTPYTISWFRNGVAIPGATNLSYTLSNAQLTDSGSTFYAVATNSAGPISSGNASLTVTAGLTGSFYQGNTDFSTQLLGGTDTVPYQGTFNITSGQPFIVTFPNPGALQYIVVRYPVSEPTKTGYKNPPINPIDQGNIPGLALRETTIGSFKYIFSATGSPFGLNNASGQNGQVQFS